MPSGSAGRYRSDAKPLHVSDVTSASRVATVNAGSDGQSRVGTKLPRRIRSWTIARISCAGIVVPAVAQPRSVRARIRARARDRPVDAVLADGTRRPRHGRRGGALGCVSACVHGTARAAACPAVLPGAARRAAGAARTRCTARSAAAPSASASAFSTGACRAAGSRCSSGASSASRSAARLIDTAVCRPCSARASRAALGSAAAPRASGASATSASCTRAARAAGTGRARRIVAPAADKRGSSAEYQQCADRYGCSSHRILLTETRDFGKVTGSNPAHDRRPPVSWVTNRDATEEPSARNGNEFCGLGRFPRVPHERRRGRLWEGNLVAGPARPVRTGPHS
jgi:hypothetical protein